jgi:hypothetical protein
MTILFDGTETRKSNRSFGRGVLASRPATAVPCTISDLAWASQTFGEISDRRDAALDRHLDALAAEAEALDRLTAGHLL